MVVIGKEIFKEELTYSRPLITHIIDGNVANKLKIEMQPFGWGNANVYANLLTLTLIPLQMMGIRITVDDVFVYKSEDFK